MNEIALVFFTMWIQDPSTAQGPQFSDTLFSTHEECGNFVDSIGNDGTLPSIVDENYEFKFASTDGLLFVGGCYTAEEYEKKYK